MITRRYYMIAICEEPEEGSLARALLSVTSKGSITSETYRVFTEQEYRHLIGGLAYASRETHRFTAGIMAVEGIDLPIWPPATRARSKVGFPWQALHAGYAPYPSAVAAHAISPEIH